MFARSLIGRKKWYFHQIFQANHSWHQLKGLVKVPLFCVKKRLCKLFQNEWTLTSVSLFTLKLRSIVSDQKGKLRLKKKVHWPSIGMKINPLSISFDLQQKHEKMYCTIVSIFYSLKCYAIRNKLCTSLIIEPMTPRKVTFCSI